MTLSRKIELVETRRTINVKPVRQLISRRNDFTRSEAERYRDAQELIELIREARKERLCNDGL